MMFQGDRVDQDKPRLFRTWSDGTLRAILSTRYQAVNNSWYMNAIREIFPDSKVIRWRGNADTLQFDVHVPGIQAEDNDSGYGGILHVGNSEIGQRSIIAQLGVLRFICTNGMIVMDSIAGIRQRHIGDIDLVDLRKRVVDTISEGLPNIEDERMKSSGRWVSRLTEWVTYPFPECSLNSVSITRSVKSISRASGKLG
jgi:hypothetical protein